MDKDGPPEMLGPNGCSNSKDCGLGKVCVKNNKWGNACMETPIKARSPKEGIRYQESIQRFVSYIKKIVLVI